MRHFPSFVTLVISIMAPVSPLSALNFADDLVNALPPIEIISQGPRFIVVNKPAPLVCHPSEYDTCPERPLFQRVRDQIDCKVNLVHRIDRGTSGAVLLCTDTSDPSFTSSLQRKLSDGQKTYLAWCRGNGEYLKKLGTGGEIMGG